MRILGLAISVILPLCAAGGSAQTADLVSTAAFRVCADPANLPMSGREEPGFENEIAALLAGELNLPLETTWFPMGPGFIRNTLRAGVCDVVIGYAQGDELVQNTNHYYTSVFVMITRKGDALTQVQSLADPLLQGRRIGIVAGTPPANHMARNGLMTSAKSYPLVVDRRVQNPAADMLADLQSGAIDAAILWGPIGGPLTKGHDAFSVMPLLQEAESPKLFYRITMGVRPAEQDWKRDLNSLIRRNQDKIDAILVQAGVPLVDDYGKALKDVSLAKAPPEPGGYRGPPYGAPVPATLAGAEVADNAMAAALHAAGEAVFIDVMPRDVKPADLPEGTVWRDKPRDSIPGSIWLPNTGFEALTPAEEAYLREGLDLATGGDFARPVVIFCRAECWMSWNVAKRALGYGYTRVIWYPDGPEGWVTIPENPALQRVEPFVAE